MTVDILVECGDIFPPEVVAFSLNGLGMWTANFMLITPLLPFANFAIASMNQLEDHNIGFNDSINAFAGFASSWASADILVQFLYVSNTLGRFVHFLQRVVHCKDSSMFPAFARFLLNVRFWTGAEFLSDFNPFQAFTASSYKVIQTNEAFPCLGIAFGS